MKFVVCNLCGQDDYEVLFEAGVAQINRIVKCRHCGLMYANPRSQAEDHLLVQGYDPDFVVEQVTTHERQRLEKEALQVRDYVGARGFLAKRFPQRGKLLEIGSGLGFLLDYFRKDGWETLGLEPNAGLCRIAESQLGLKVIPKVLQDASVPDQSIDVVLMMHVIEHVADPLQAMRDIHRVLKPGGMLVMETPRYDTLMFKLLGKRERSLSCEGHIYFFTSASLVQLCQASGFAVLKGDMVGRSLTLDRLLYNVGVVSKSDAVRTTLQWFSKIARLNKFRVSINLRDMERVFVQKIL